VALQALHAAGHEVVLVLTQPDRPAGRGMKLQASPVKQLALDLGLPLAQPRSLRMDGKYPDDAAAARAALQAAAPDVMVVAAYGLILPRWVLALPRHGCLNIHGSLLPRWRGAAPIHRAIEAGDTETGITIMQMDAGLDTGDMLLVQRMPIMATTPRAPCTTAWRPWARSSSCRRLDVLACGRLQHTVQDSSLATYAHKISKSEALVDWQQSAARWRRLRAFDPFPGASTELAGQTLKVWRGQAVPGTGQPGQVLAAGEGRLVVACGQGALELLELQVPGGRRISAREFLQRHPL
jgi:methionyl-tRNA formyltransferase